MNTPTDRSAASERERVVSALALLQSVIQSGERWTEQCYTAVCEALAQYDALEARRADTDSALGRTLAVLERVRETVNASEERTMGGIEHRTVGDFHG